MLSIALIESYLDNAAATGDVDSCLQLASRLDWYCSRVQRTRLGSWESKELPAKEGSCQLGVLRGRLPP